MSEYTQVNAGAMQQGIGDLQAAYNSTDSTLTTLEGELEQSLAQWDGDARAAYSQAKAKWDAAAAHMASVIQKMTSTLGQIDEGYASNEARTTSMWS